MSTLIPLRLALEPWKCSQRLVSQGYIIKAINISQLPSTAHALDLPLLNGSKPVPFSMTGEDYHTSQ